MNSLLQTRRSEMPGLYVDRWADPFTALHREVDRFLNETYRNFGRPALSVNGDVAAMEPKIDIYETEKELKISAELPGVNEEDVQITLNDNVLTIKGEKKTAWQEQKDNYLVRERSTGSFARSIRITQNVNPDKVEASFDDGVVTITMPLPPEAHHYTRNIALKKAH